MDRKKKTSNRLLSLALKWRDFIFCSFCSSERNRKQCWPEVTNWIESKKRAIPMNLTNHIEKSTKTLPCRAKTKISLLIFTENFTNHKIFIYGTITILNIFERGCTVCVRIVFDRYKLCSRSIYFPAEPQSQRYTLLGYKLKWETKTVWHWNKITEEEKKNGWPEMVDEEQKESIVRDVEWIFRYLLLFQMKWKIYET